MYAPGFGYGANNPNGAPQQHHPHPQQPGQPQHLMYNPQQVAGGSPGMGGPNAGGMMQNNGMAQMAGPHVSQYQTPYSGAAYAPHGANVPPNFMATPNASAYQMNPTMTPQQMQHMQRMQPPSTPSQPGQRGSPFAGAHGNTPPATQPQFSTPQTANAISSNNQAAIVTPQTPNFPPGAQNGGDSSTMATPLSPGSEVVEKDRVTLLLEINRELLLEVMALQAVQAELKKEASSPSTSSSEAGDKEKADKEKAERGKVISKEYIECMRRLQANLGYLAAIADRAHKPESQIPSHPAVMTAPPLSPRPPPSTSSTNSPASETKKEETDEKDSIIPGEDRSKRVETLKAQYQKLQELFPGVDPTKDTPTNPANASGGAAKGQTQKPGGAQSTDPSNAQQKLQNDQLRMKMMQQAQAQGQLQQQQQGVQGR